MGVRLIVEVLDHAPEELTAVDRLLLIVIAENANDTTREGYPGWELIARRMRWAGHKDGGKNAVRVALANLASRGVDVRVPITQGKDGRPVYAAHGHRTVYRLPRFRRGADTAHLEGGQVVPTSTGEGGQSPYAKGGNPYTRRGAATAPPSPHEPSREPSSPRGRSRVESLIAAAGAADEEEIQAAIEKIKAEHQPRSLPGYIDALARSGDLAPIVAAVHTERTRGDVAQTIADARSGPQCIHGEPGGAVLHPSSNEPLCALCRVAARRRSA